jgi:CHAD domain-containing protein
MHFSANAKVYMRKAVSDASHITYLGGYTPRLSFPFRSCRETILKLMKALTECQGTPQAEPVRTLRRVSRHLQAQLTLLRLLQDQLIPACIDRIRKPLKRIGRAAGRVRDLDAQYQLVVKDASRTLKDNTDYAREGIAQDVAHLRKHLAKRRNAEALRLVHVLNDEQEHLTEALRDARDALQTLEDQSFTTEELSIRIRSWLRSTALDLHEPTIKCPPSPRRDARKGTDHLDPLMVERLHGLRKVAKTARYMVETLSSKAAGTRQLVLELKSIQRLGGEWHDWLLLERMSAKHSKKRTSLVKQYAKNRDAALIEYVKILDRANWMQSTLRHRSSRLPHRTTAAVKAR